MSQTNPDKKRVKLEAQSQLISSNTTIIISTFAMVFQMSAVLTRADGPASTASIDIFHSSSSSSSAAAAAFYLTRPSRDDFTAECYINQYHTPFDRSNRTTKTMTTTATGFNEQPPPQERSYINPASYGGDLVVGSLQVYIEEFKAGFKVLLDEASIDERLANIIYSVEMKTVVNFDFFRFNSGDPTEDRQNERLAAGPKVNEAVCGVHLTQMLEQMDELGELLDKRRRANDSTSGEPLQPKYIHLARVLDSFGRYESGYMSGRTHSFGSYEQCLNTPLMLPPSDTDSGEPVETAKVKSRFCWARLNIDRHLNPALRSRRKTHLEPGSHVLSTGICIPESCHSSSFARHEALFQRLISTQFKLPKSIYLDENLHVESIFCTIDEDSQLARVPTGGKILLTLIAGWLLLTVCVTLHENNNCSVKSDSGSEDERNGINELALAHRHDAGGALNSRLRAALQCLDLKRSWQDFVGIPSTESTAAAATAKKSQQTNELESITDGSNGGRRRVDFDTLNPVRWLGCTFVVWAHALLVRMGFSQDQLQLAQQLERDTSGGLVIVSSAVVDTFFAITGLFMAYITLKKASRRTSAIKQPVADKLPNSEPTTQPISSPASQFFHAIYQIVRTRYLRLLPMLLLVYTFKRTVFIYLGHGPLWDFGLNQETAYGACQRESWLVPLLVGASFKPLSRQCLMQSWSVSCDLYLTAMLAPVLVIMTRKPRLAIALLLSLCLVSFQFLLRAIQQLDPGDGFAVSDLRAQGMGAMYARISHVYSHPLTRVSSFAIGIMAGYALYWYDQEEDGHQTKPRKARQWPQWMRGPCTKWALFWVMLVFTLLANASKLRHTIQPYHFYLFPMFMTIGKLLWALANCVLFLRMMTDWSGSFWMRAAAGQFWQSLSKLNYGILLIHFDLLLYDISTPAQANLNNLYSIFRAFAAVYLTCIVISLATFVLFENPMDKLIKQLVLAAGGGVAGRATREETIYVTPAAKATAIVAPQPSKTNFTTTTTTTNTTTIKEKTKIDDIINQLDE